MHDQNIRSTQRGTFKIDLFYSKGLHIVETFQSKCPIHIEFQVIFKRRPPPENAPPPNAPRPKPAHKPLKIGLCGRWTNMNAGIILGFLRFYLSLPSCPSCLIERSSVDSADPFSAEQWWWQTSLEVKNRPKHLNKMQGHLYGWNTRTIDKYFSIQHFLPHYCIS